ncbi:MAG: Spy/CpxP family protein refolding chaperone [Thermoanaerobaculia bacterium]|nr:Spy/CpxP family protein refolding chaperone [Thermoanaerobaculia bacterium]
MIQSLSRISFATIIILALISGRDSIAQTSHDHHSSYAGQEGSEIAGLSAREVEQLVNGEGMGLARPAELNHYPGPMHVLEAAEELALTEEQERQTRSIFERMKAEAKRIGSEIIEKERELSRRFEHRHIDREMLAELTGEIGLLRAKLRATHLEAHLEMAEVLTPEQVAEYDTLRGYI